MRCAARRSPTPRARPTRSPLPPCRPNEPAGPPSGKRGVVADALVRIVFQGDEAVQGADRISQALTRMERSEPTRALRSTRMAIDELTTAATGLHPIFGRLIAGFSQRGLGGEARLRRGG